MKESKHRIGLVDKDPQVGEKNRIGHWVLFIFVVLAVGQATHVFWQKHNLHQDIETAKERIAGKEASIEERTSGAGYAGHLQRSDVLAQVEESRIDWSVAETELDRLRRVLQSNVIMETYTSTPQGDFTLQGVAGSIESVAVLIDAFDLSTTFQDHFVTNISEQRNSGTFVFNGVRPPKVYRFTLTFSYES